MEAQVLMYQVMFGRKVNFPLMRRSGVYTALLESFCNSMDRETLDVLLQGNEDPLFFESLENDIHDLIYCIQVLDEEVEDEEKMRRDCLSLLKRVTGNGYSASWKVVELVSKDPSLFEHSFLLNMVRGADCTSLDSASFFSFLKERIEQRSGEEECRSCMKICVEVLEKNACLRPEASCILFPIWLSRVKSCYAREAVTCVTICLMDGLAKNASFSDLRQLRHAHLHMRSVLTSCCMDFHPSLLQEILSMEEIGACVTSRNEVVREASCLCVLKDCIHRKDHSHYGKELLESIKQCVTREIKDLFLDPDHEILDYVFEFGTLLGMNVDHLRSRIDFIKTRKKSEKRAASLGISSSSPPDGGFECPISMETMQDPVIASDGHSYERKCLDKLLSQTEPRSPLTREVLDPSIMIPNINLRKRIRNYLDDICDAVDKRMKVSLQRGEKK